MIYLLIVSLIWAFSFSLIKTQLAGLDSTFVAAIRLGISLVVFLPFLRFKNVKKKDSFRLILTGAVQYGLMYIAYIYSFRFLKAYEVALFTIFTPLYVTIVDSFLRRNFSWVTYLTTLLAITGTGVVVITNLQFSDFLFGFLIVQISNICFAFGQIYYRQIMKEYPEVKDIHVFGWLYLGAFGLSALSTLFLTSWQSIQIQPNQILVLLYMGAIASGLSLFLWNLGARKVNSGTLAIFNDLKVPLATCVSTFLFSEKADVPRLLVGGGIVLAALLLNEWNAYRQSHQSVKANSATVK